MKTLKSVLLTLVLLAAIALASTLLADGFTQTLTRAEASPCAFTLDATKIGVESGGFSNAFSGTYDTARGETVYTLHAQLDGATIIIAGLTITDAYRIAGARTLTIRPSQNEQGYALCNVSK